MAEHDPFEDELRRLGEIIGTTTGVSGATVTPEGDPASTPGPQETTPFGFLADISTGLPELDAIFLFYSQIGPDVFALGGGPVLANLFGEQIRDIFARQRAERGPTEAQVRTTEQQRDFEREQLATRQDFSSQLAELQARLGFQETQLREGGLAGRQVFSAGVALQQQTLAGEIRAAEGQADFGRQLAFRAEQRQSERVEFQQEMFKFFLSNPNAFFSALRLRQMGVSLFDTPQAPGAVGEPRSTELVNIIPDPKEQVLRLKQKKLIKEAAEARADGLPEDAAELEAEAAVLTKQINDVITANAVKQQTAFDKLPQNAPVNVSSQAPSQQISLGGFLDDVLSGGTGQLPTGFASPGFDPVGLAQLAKQFGSLSGSEFFSKLSPTTVQGLPPSVRSILFTEAQIRGMTTADVQSIIQRATPALTPQRQRTLTSR